MGSKRAEPSSKEPESRPGRIQIEDAGGRRPFMRGILIHSLVARGVPFDEAFRVANTAREQLRDRPVVQREELAKIVTSLLGADQLPEPSPPLPPDITVAGDGGELPFSKGHLSQSLLAAAIEPNDAFDVSRDIERGLIARGVRTIERSELRRLAYEALVRDAGEEVAERYLAWRRYQEPERPVIVLLGGAAGVGKTSLALEVAHRLGIGRVLSTDSIRQIMRIMLSPELVPALHGSSYDAHRLLPPAALGDDPVIEGFRAQASIVSVGIRASMDRAVAENASLVIDGVSLVPGMIDLSAYQELADVFFVVVATLNEKALANRFRSRGQGQRLRGTARYIEHLDAILKIQDHFLELADKHDVPIVDNASFDRSVLFVIRHLTETLSKRGDFDVAELL